MSFADRYGTLPMLFGQDPSTPTSPRAREVLEDAKMMVDGLRRQISSPASRIGALDLERKRERLAFQEARLKLASMGIAHPGAAFELRRNQLAMELGSVSGAKKAKVESWVGFYDDKLAKVDAKVGSASRAPVPRSHARMPRIADENAVIQAMSLIDTEPGQLEVPDLMPLRGPSQEILPFREVRRSKPGRFDETPPKVQKFIDESRILGVGGMQFKVESPPGPGRLVRVPFYPANSSYAWSGSNGIDAPNDDPVLRITLTNDQPISNNPSGFATVQPYVLNTERFDYGAYRIVGIQCRMPSGYGPRFPTVPTIAPWREPFVRPEINPKGISVSISSLNLYNGEQLLLPVGELDARSVDLSGASGAGLIDTFGGSGFLLSPARSAPYTNAKRKAATSSGLRDYPVLDGNARVSVTIGAFTTGLVYDPAKAPGPITLELPFTIHLIAEIVDDYVYGSPVTLSPVSRPGANLKLASRYVGVNQDGVPQLHVVNPTFERDRNK